MQRGLNPVLKFVLILGAVGGVVFGGKWVINNTSFGSKIASSVAPGGKQVGSTSGKVATRRVSGGDNEPVNVCVVTWGGYAGGQYFNGGFEASTDSRYYKDYGILVNFKVIDDFVPSRDAWKADQCQVLWATVDAFTTEVADLAKYEPQVLFQADWSRGGDALVVRRGINSVADLKGKKVAFLSASPSNTLLLWVLDAGGLDYSDVKPVTTPSAPEAARLFKTGAVDAAVVWSPDDEDCVQSVPGASVLQSSRTASQIIPDVFFAKGAWVRKNRDKVHALVEGWLRGAAEINSSDAAREQAVKVLARGLKQPEDFVRKAISNARLTTYGDNVNFFNLSGTYRGVKGEDVYNRMGSVYHAINLAPESLPNWRTVVDTSALGSIEQLTGQEHAAESGATFTEVTPADATAPAVATRRVSVHFDTGSAELDDNAKALVDAIVAPLAKSFAHSRFRIEGNTDNRGSAKVNQSLSEERARAVANYLAQEYGFHRNRFVVVGNGPAKPVAPNATDDGRAKNRRTDFDLLN